MDDQLYFLVYCIENYKNVKGLNGRQIIELFNKYQVLDYIKTSYGALHTTGKEYIIEDLDHYINMRKHMV